MRLPLTPNVCATARKLIAGGVDPDELLEFIRPGVPDDVVSLRGPAKAFAARRVKSGGHVPVKRPRRRRPARILVLG